jgi:hypothetical protein
MRDLPDIFNHQPYLCGAKVIKLDHTYKSCVSLFHEPAMGSTQVILWWWSMEINIKYTWTTIDDQSNHDKFTSVDVLYFHEPLLKSEIHKIIQGIHPHRMISKLYISPV